MKHRQLCAIAHNLADSLASGICLRIGYCDVDIFGEAARSGGGVIGVDFLAGTTILGSASPSLAHAVALYARDLPDFSHQHGAAVEDFTGLSATFRSDAIGRYVTVTVVDRDGRQTVTDYTGTPLKRRRILDSLGRVRPAPRRSS